MSIFLKTILSIITFSSFAFADIIGETQGNFTVGQTGSALYHVDLTVPKGTNNLQPSISLEYNSHYSNGIMGAGWTINGFSTIQRCPSTIEQDNIRGTINYDFNDRFCLDGVRLIAVRGTDGQSGTEYRTEIDTFSQITSYGISGNGPDWFEVKTKDGKIIEYGRNNNSKIFTEFDNGDNREGTVRVWAVSKESDLIGNSINYEYGVDENRLYRTSSTSSSMIGFYPIRIDYGRALVHSLK
ncbi:hypothetical protein EP073_08355 [Geovibrio thiophilus]|uniref:Virulence plasmid B protein n=1 Tax=Geovibrio thiophilus TaxID=139438 RepID=A0A3R5XXW0_9BACT|nr:SpvB/TcaC N-terminal domain-containing protein [Geovibrio thiophilus]QAR33410.1 hypothetical protein EP073_08355 [Geovibrio thiophilus]